MRPAKVISNIFFWIIFVSGLGSCSNFILLSNGAFRPKAPGFDPLYERAGFPANPMLNTGRLYLGIREYEWPRKPFRWDTRDTITHNYGFYPDGRFINGFVFKEEIDSALFAEGSFASADNIGYYFSSGNKLQAQFFGPSSDGIGYYYVLEGIIRGDTILVVRPGSISIGSPDTLVLSNFGLRE